MNPDAIVQELLSRNVPLEEIERVNPSLGAKVRSGIIAPRLSAPDKVAERGAYIADYKKLSERREALGRYYGDTRNLDRFHELNFKQGTGGLKNNIPVIDRINEMMSPEIKEMSGIASTLQGKARPVGSGATSDFEQRLYRQGVPSPDKPGPVNESIIHHMKGVLQEESDRTAFDEEFLRRNGSLAGSQEAWSRYTAANPYTVSDQHGHSRLNSKRADWRVHFGLAKAAPQQQPASGGAKDPYASIREGQVVEQGGQRWRKVNGRMVPVK